MRCNLHNVYLKKQQLYVAPIKTGELCVCILSVILCIKVAVHSPVVIKVFIINVIFTEVGLGAGAGAALHCISPC